MFLLLTRINGLPQNTTMKGHSQHNPSLIGRKNQAKFENDCVLTNGYRIKITQSNLMILVSFSSAGVAWFEDVKRYGTFWLQVTENPPFRFLWDTRYIRINCKDYLKKVNRTSIASTIKVYCVVLSASSTSPLPTVISPLKRFKENKPSPSSETSWRRYSMPSK